MKTLRQICAAVAIPSGILFLACHSCHAQSTPNWANGEFAEVNFDIQQQIIQIQTPSATQQLQFDASGNFAQIQNLTTGQNVALIRDPFGQPNAFQMWSNQTPSQPPVVVPISPSDNLQNLLDKWSTAGSGITVGGDALSLAMKAVISDRFNAQLESALGASGASAVSAFAASNQSSIDRAFGAAGWGLAVSQDIGALLVKPNLTAQDVRDNLLLGGTAQLGVQSLASKLTEKAVAANAGALGETPMLERFGLFDDVLGKEPQALDYAAGIRGSVAGQVVGIGFDWLRGNRFDSIDQDQHYLDLALTGIWSAIPITRPFAPYVSDVAGFASQAIRPFAEAQGKAAGENDPGSVATQLYDIALMTLTGVKSGKTFAQADIDALSRVSSIAGNADYQALIQAFESGDKAGAAATFAKLEPLLLRGGYSQSTLDAMQNALLGSSAPAQGAKDLEKQLGGVSLRARPQRDLIPGALQAVTYDPASGQVIVVTDSSRLTVGLRVEDLAAAFAAMIVGRKEGHTRIIGFPEFSLDPAEPTRPDGPWYKAVYLPQFLRGTEMAAAMAAADFKLKQLSLGQGAYFLGQTAGQSREALPGHGLMALSDGSKLFFSLRRLSPAIPGFQAIPDLDTALARQGRGSQASRNRLWIVVDRPIPISVSGGACVFDQPIMMGVRARAQGIGRDGQLVDVNASGAQDPAAQAFARYMTENYNRIAASEPSFAALRDRFAPAVAVVEWIRNRGGRAESLDLEWIRPFLTNHQEPEMLGVTRIGYSEKSETIRKAAVKGGVQIITEKRFYEIFGGCDLHLEERSTASAKVAAFAKTAQKALEQNPGASVFPVTFEGRKCTGTILPTSKEGRERWEAGAATVAENGITYSVEGAGATRRVTSSRDSRGTVRHYEWDAAGIASVRAESPDGWSAVGGRPNASGETVITLKSPSKAEYQFSWSADQRTCEILRNGHQILEVRDSIRDRKTRVSTCAYLPSGAIEEISREANGAVRYRRKLSRNGKDVSEEISLQKDGAGRLASISNQNGATFHLDRDARGNIKSAAVGTQTITIDYGDGRFPALPTAIRSGAFAARVTYDHGLAKTLDLSSRDDSAHAEFDAGRMVKVTDGKISQNFEYFNNGHLKRLSDSLGAEAAWDSNGQLMSAVQPGGVRVVPEYDRSTGTPRLTSLKFFKPNP